MPGYSRFVRRGDVQHRRRDAEGARFGGVTWSMRERTLLALRLTYEILWGTNTGWDYLTEENAARSIDLLNDLLVFLAALFERVADLPMRV
jgi:hypothetical protein